MHEMSKVIFWNKNILSICRLLNKPIESKGSMILTINIEVGQIIVHVLFLDIWMNT